METRATQWVVDHTVLDIPIKDTSSLDGRNSSRRVRPHLTCCFSYPDTSLCAYILDIQQPNQSTLAAHLYNAIAPSHGTCCERVPNEIWTDTTHLFVPRIQQVLQALHITLRSHPPQRTYRSEGERFLRRVSLHLNSCASLSTGLQRSMNEEEILDLTLDDVDNMLEQFFAELGDEGKSTSSLQKKEGYRDSIRLLDGLLTEPAKRIVLKNGIRYRGRLYWHSELAHVEQGQEVAVCCKPVPTIPSRVEVFSQDHWLCSASLL